ncbi:MAG: PLP-dependent aminotransferase family protein [Maritimibacter sp.]|nr:PLP-dependent aminotransferase family protein [Maritimibacter sp.]
METGEGPKYRRLLAGLKQAIDDGELVAGDKLPPVRDLAWKIGVTPGTVARAFTLLAETGRVQAEVGRGTFVTDPGARQVPAPARSPVAAPDARAAASAWRTRAPEAIQPLYVEMPAEDDVFFAPRLADLGQIALVREGLRRAAEAPVEQLLAYPTFASHAALREAVLAWVPDDLRAGVTTEQVVLTNGGQNANLLVLQALLFDAPPVLLTEDLTYTGVLRAAELLGARVLPIPMDEEGARPDALEAAAREHGAQVFFTMPEAQNPTARTTSTRRRVAIAEIADRLGIDVIQDDCYRLGPPTGPSYRALMPERGWYLSSLSKAISPALRVGFAVAPEAAVTRLRRVVDTNFYGLARPMADVAAHVLTHPDTPALVEAARVHMAGYVRAAVNALGRFDIGWDENIPFLWLRLPRGWREAAFVQALAGIGIRVRPGSDFVDRDARAVNAVRISVNGQMPLERFSGAMQRIAQLLDHPPERSMA